MKKIKSAVSLLLCLAMLLALTACGSDTTPTEAATTAPLETAAPTTEPAPDYAARYADAKAAVLAMTDLELELVIDEVRTVGQDSFKNSSATTLIYQNLGTEQMTAQADDRCSFGQKTANSSFYYANGKGYTSCNGGHFYTEMTAEAFTELFLPAVLVDETLYREVTAEETDTGLQLTFTGADTLESWMDQDSGFQIPSQIRASASLRQDGSLKETGYAVTYSVGGMEVELTARATVKAPDEIPDVTNALARLNSKAIEIPDLHLPLLLEQAKGDIAQATSLTAATQDNLVLTAAEISLNQTSSFNTFGSNASYGATIETNKVMTDFTSGTLTNAYTEDFRDGKYTITEQGGNPIDYPNVLAQDLQFGIQKSFTDYIPALSAIETMTMSATGSNLLLEYTMNDDCAELRYNYVCNTLLDQPGILNELSTDYAVDTMTGYLSIDLSTFLPVTVGSTYASTMQVEGEAHAMTEQYLSTLFLGGEASYEAIFDEPLPEEKPSNPATPLLYHVTGKDGEEMWMLGTIHVGDSRTAFLPQAVYDAFDASDALAVEFDIQEFDENSLQDPDLLAKLIASYYYTDGTRLADHLDPATYEEAIVALKAIGSYDLMGTGEVLRPVVVSSMIDNYITRQGYRLSPDKGVDNRLLTRAKAFEKKILDVESAEEQMDMMSGFSDELQQWLLQLSIASNPIEANQSTQDLYELWCQGDEAALIAAINEDPQADEELTDEEKALYEEYLHAMSTDRNDDMLEIAESYLSSGDVVFYAVGLAHLLAGDGLVNTLRAAGYTVELVPVS